MQSALYFGQVRHRRVKPVQHGFRYSLFMVYLDLTELDRVFAGRWLWSIGKPNLAWLRRADHFGDPGIPLDTAVRDLVAERTGKRPEGKVRMLAHLRYFGHCFNPVTFYYCFDQEEREVETIIAEIHNTPWGQVHCYVLELPTGLGPGERQRFRFGKTFHISPFMPMDLTYDWEFSRPGDAIHVHMYDVLGGEEVFEAQLDLVRREVTGRHLSLALLRFPLMTVKVLAGIYWQALKLRLKGAVYYPPPQIKSGPGG
jgi:DUF1365 family protein